MSQINEMNSAEIESKGRVYLNFEPRIELSQFIKDQTIGWLEVQKGYNSLNENMVIHGDNLTAMAALRISWLLTGMEKKFDAVYIDPPYNVGGNTGYKNNWKGESEGNYGWAGNHGKFLDFMEPRLRMAKLLMDEGGVIFVSICDAEYPRLLLLMEEIFGESNLVGTFIWDKKQGSQSEHLKAIHEYVICFAKNKNKSFVFEQLKPGCMEIIQKGFQFANSSKDNTEAISKLKKWLKEQSEKGEITEGLASYNLIHPISKRVFASNPTCAQDDNGSRCRLALKHPITGELCPVPSKGWKWKEDTVASMVDYDNVVEFEKGYICGDFLFGPDHTTVPRKVAYLDEMTKQKPSSIIRTKSAGHGDLPPGISFPTPKPIELIEQLFNFIPSKNIRVLDFFAGSGTTAHVIENMNKIDGGKRKYALIEEMESTVKEVIIPRLEHVSGKNTFSFYKITQKSPDSVDLFTAFQRHSEEFVKDLHAVDKEDTEIKEGVRIVGYSTKNNELIATLTQELRDPNSKTYFREEHACLAKALIKYNAKTLILYRIELGKEEKEEPWYGIKQNIFVGTPCEYYHYKSLPSAIIKAWQDTRIALGAN